MWEAITNNNSCNVCQYSERSKRIEESFLDKENLTTNLSPVKNEELSFYGNSSPTVPLCTGTSPNHCSHNIILRRPLEDQDPNSRDSGYLTIYSDGGKVLSFTSPVRGLSRLSFGSGSMEDEFFEDFSDIEPLEDNNLPQDFSKLINGSITLSTSRSRQLDKKPSPSSTVTTTKDLIIRPLFRRALSLQNDNLSNSRVRSCLFKTNNEPIRKFKRPEPPTESSDNHTNIKKAKINDSSEHGSSGGVGDDDEDGDDEEEEELPAVSVRTRPVLKRAFSATEESIMCAVQRSSTEPDLIGDFSKTFCLPMIQGRHQDLKSITPNTLAELLKGIYDKSVATFKVIDCRYPYEYDGGHISGAINIYTKDQCLDLLHNCQIQDQNLQKRNILVFHCEFSSERGPNLCRYLRKQDRQLNQDMYPSLHYPELYILEGGYKNFFQQFSHLCIPIAYKEMLHPEHENELRFFRQKSKTWNVDTRQRSMNRANSKRLGL